MSAKVILIPKFYRLSTDPAYLEDLRRLANSLWEESGRPEGSRQAYSYLARRENEAIKEEVSVRVNGGKAIICYYEFRLVPSALPCHNCQMDQAFQPDIGVYKIQTIGEEYFDGRIKYAAFKQVLRVRFAGGFPWCYRPKCKKAYQEILDFMHRTSKNQRA